MIQKKLTRFIGDLLEREGYRRHGTAWYLEKSDFLSKIELDKSRWGDKFDIGVSFYLRVLGYEHRSKTPLCHIKSALSVAPEPNQALRNAMDFVTQTIPEIDRESAIRDAIVAFVDRYVRNISNWDDMKKLYEKDAFRAFYMTWQARAKLEGHDEEGKGDGGNY